MKIIELDDSDGSLELVDVLPGIVYWRAGIWRKRLEPLRAHPGVWARVRLRDASKQKGTLASMAHHINVHATTLPPGIWRAASRGGDLYVCFCGDTK